MIPYIDSQLIRWAEWLRTGNTRLGYPSQSAFVSAMGGGGGQPVVMPDDDAMAINRAVAALDPELKTVVDCVYRTMRGCTGEAIAEYLGCHRDTVYARLHRAHVAVMGYLEDIAAGIPLPGLADKSKPRHVAHG